MTGYKEERKPGVWSLVVYLGRDAQGKKKQKWHTFKGGERAAQRELNRLLSAIDSGEYVAPTKQTVSAFLEQWLTDYAQTAVRPTTFDFYCVLIRKQLTPRLGALTLSKLTPQAIQGAYADMLRNGRCDGKGGLSPRTVRHCHTVLHTALTFAVRWQLLARNPAEAVEPPKVREQEPVPLEDSQLAQALTQAAGTWLEIPVLLSAFTGMRRGEVLAVRWSDIDTEEGIIHIRQTLQRTSDGLRFGTPKTEKGRRRIEIGPELLERLQRHQKEQARHRFQRLQAEQGWENLDLVVCQEDGSPRTPDNLTHAFLKLTRRAGIAGANFHALRHTHATHLLMDGEPVNVVQERLGHSAASITMDRYGHVLPGRQKVAAAKSDAQFLRVMGATG